MLHQIISSETYSGSTGQLKRTPRPLYHVDAISYGPYQNKKMQ